MKPIQLELSLEQQFSLRQSETVVAKLSQAQAQGFLIEVLHQLMVKDNAIRSLIKSQLGIETSSSDGLSANHSSYQITRNQS
jgi:Phycobilisome degradation protein nblA